MTFSVAVQLLKTRPDIGWAIAIHVIFHLVMNEKNKGKGVRSVPKGIVIMWS